nr:zinc finger, CCHC-type [Tanacetum cinerariifolium]
AEEKKAEIKKTAKQLILSDVRQMVWEMQAFNKQLEETIGYYCNPLLGQNPSKPEPNEKTKADNKKDKTAIAFLYQSLPEEQLLQITKHKTAKAIWDALKTRHMGEQRVQQARLQTLNSEFEMLQMKEDETINTFTGKLTTLANKAASLGHTFEDQP